MNVYQHQACINSLSHKNDDDGRSVYRGNSPVTDVEIDAENHCSVSRRRIHAAAAAASSVEIATLPT